jgi:hypothetical protein
MTTVLWGVPPYKNWTGGAIRIERGSNAAYDRRKREGWTGLRLLPQGRPYPTTTTEETR